MSCITTTAKKSLYKRLKDDRAFMGKTHAVSGVAAALAIAAWAPDVMTRFTGELNPWIITLAAICFAGAALVPDLDNTSATAKSSLGYLGMALSFMFRESARLIQTVIKTKRDDPTPDPHRGFWHTIPAALLLGLVTMLATQSKTIITLPIIGEITKGGVTALIITTIMCHLALSGLAADFMRKVKKSNPLGEVIASAISIIISVIIFSKLPTELHYGWLGFSIAGGAIAHILGDGFTKAGIPLLFPFSGFIKKKFWWKTRFTHMQAGGTVENLIVFPIFIVISVIALLKLLNVF